MGKVRTSSNLYRRGVPNSFAGFGYVAQGNYSIVAPTYLFAPNNIARPNARPLPVHVPKSTLKFPGKKK